MEKEPCIHLLISEDHTIIRKSLIKLISDFNFSHTIIEASSGEDVLKVLTETKSIDILLLDIEMKEMGGVRLLKILKERHINIKVIILTKYQEDSLICLLMKLGVHCFLSKYCNPQELETAIQEVYFKNAYYNDLMVNAIKKNFTEKSENYINLDLSMREFQVTALLRDGKSNKEMASILQLTTRTIESYRKLIMKKTKCKNVAELVALMYRTGLLPQNNNFLISYATSDELPKSISTQDR